MNLPVRTPNQEHALRSPASSTETFTDTNVTGLVHLAIGSGSGSAARPSVPPPDSSWAAELSGSFAIIAEQLQNASRTIAAAHASPQAATTTERHLLTVRLDALEKAQERLVAEFAGLRSLHTAGRSQPEDDSSWATALSGSFAIIASQLQSASRIIASMPVSQQPADHHHHLLTARLDAIEQAQERLAVEIAGLRGSRSRDELRRDDSSWVAELTGSFAAIAEQLQNASRTIAAVPASPAAADHQSLTARLDAIEQAQERLAVELAGLRSLHAGKSRDEIRPEASSNTSSADLERRLTDAVAAQKLDQDRLYGRLYNSRVTVSKMPIMALTTASGKPPPDHPKTKGEFEHLTKERYEGLLRAYNQPVEGDTAAKREALRIFLGLPA